MKAASSGFRNPNAAKPMPMPSTTERSGEILHNRPPAAPRDAQSLDQLGKIVPDQHHFGAFASHVCSGPHGHADRSLHQCRRIVDSVPDHGHGMARRSQGFDILKFAFREKFGNHFVNAQVLADAFRRSLRVPCEEHGPESHGFQRLKRPAGLRPEPLRNDQASQISATTRHVDLSARRSGRQCFDQDAASLQKSAATDDDLLARPLSAYTSSRTVFEMVGIPGSILIRDASRSTAWARGCSERTSAIAAASSNAAGATPGAGAPLPLPACHR